MALSEAVVDYSPSIPGETEQFEYRAFSTSAIAAAIFGALSLLTVLAGRDSLESALLLCPIPVLGLILGVRSLSAINAMPEHLSGRKLAITGIVLSLVGLVGGLCFAGFVHATEVPEGAIRTSFNELRPSEKDERAGIPIPKEIQKLDGQRVFIKGYMRPDSTPVRSNIRRFLLVRDNNQCCFGDLSSVKYFDQILVDLTDNLATDFSTGLFRIAGTLRIQPQNLLAGSPLPVFFIEADYVQ